MVNLHLCMDLNSGCSTNCVVVFLNDLINYEQAEPPTSKMGREVGEGLGKRERERRGGLIQF